MLDTENMLGQNIPFTDSEPVGGTISSIPVTGNFMVPGTNPEAVDGTSLPSMLLVISLFLFKILV
jgi:hypothetical protein